MRQLDGLAAPLPVIINTVYWHASREDMQTRMLVKLCYGYYIIAARAPHVIILLHLPLQAKID